MPDDNTPTAKIELTEDECNEFWDALMAGIRMCRTRTRHQGDAETLNKLAGRVEGARYLTFEFKPPEASGGES